MGAGNAPSAFPDLINGAGRANTRANGPAGRQSDSDEAA
jgi:hypothetical protein